MLGSDVVALTKSIKGGVDEPFRPLSFGDEEIVDDGDKRGVDAGVFNSPKTRNPFRLPPPESAQIGDKFLRPVAAGAGLPPHGRVALDALNATVFRTILVDQTRGKIHVTASRSPNGTLTMKIGIAHIALRQLSIANRCIGEKELACHVIRTRGVEGEWIGFALQLRSPRAAVSAMTRLECVV